MRQGLTITLLEDCVFSARPATSGGHESLDYIPGQALLGVAAATLYGRLSRDEAFQLFHSGAVRFGNGLPWRDGAVAWPVPLAWHAPKEAELAGDDLAASADALYNFQHGSELPGRLQPRQLRGGYVRRDGRRFNPATELRMKTAIDPETGRAAEGQLFGYDALARGATFATTVEADDSVAPEQFEAIVDALVGERFMGRSRSAEYGRVQIERAEVPAVENRVDGQRVTLWLLSDLALVDEWGQPTLLPETHHLGLGDGRVDWDATFLRSRRYSPWNAWRGGFDRERDVLNAGGVITLELEREPTAEQLAALASGAGLYREAGLGRLWLNPPLLAHWQPVFEPLVATATGESRAVARPDHPLIDWLEAVDGSHRHRVEERVRTLFVEWRELLRRSRRDAGLSEDVARGPSASQWSSVGEAARRISGDKLLAQLFEASNGIIGKSAKAPNKGWNPGWSDEYREEGGSWWALGAWLQQRLRSEREQFDEATFAELVAGLAHRARDAARRKQGETV